MRHSAPYSFFFLNYDTNQIIFSHPQRNRLIHAASAGYILNYTIPAGAIIGRSDTPIMPGKIGLMEPMLATVQRLGYPFYVGEGSSVVGAVSSALEFIFVALD